MRFARLATYDLVQGTFAELVELAETGMLPVFAREAGFVDYGLVDTGLGKVVSISIWETRERAESAVNVAQLWVQENMADRIHLVSDVVGDLALFRGAPIAA